MPLCNPDGVQQNDISLAHPWRKTLTRGEALLSGASGPIFVLGGHCPAREKTGYPGALMDSLGGCP
jgi:hypothetical protein